LYSQDAFSPVVSLERFPRNPEWIEIGTVAATGEIGIEAGSKIETGTETEAGIAGLVGADETGIAIMRLAVRGTVSVK
jgi:hypothetical protein